MNLKIPLSSSLLMLPILVSFAFAQHEHGETAPDKPKPPTVFLDKSPRVVEYQLKRLSNEQLLLVKTANDDEKYGPVFSAILSREGMPAAQRLEALQGLVDIHESSPAEELVAAILNIKGSDEEAQRGLRNLASLLLKLAPDVLSDRQESLNELASADNTLLTPVGMAALIRSGNAAEALALAEANGSEEQLLKGITWVPNAKRRAEMHQRAMDATAMESPVATRNAAITALATIPEKQNETFQHIAQFVEDDDLRAASIKTLLALPAAARDAKRSAQLVRWLVDFAEATPASERTTDSFIDAMELVDQLMALVPEADATKYRQRLRETVVRVVRIRTVEEEMRYDLPYFAVEAGRPIQVVLINDDMMPHNLVFTQPGALQEVAELGLQAGPKNGANGKQYVPESDKVLHATQMVNAHELEALTFTAPTTPGEYPYVCTFPRHWMRMYGVMVVVEDLDAWLKAPVVPKDPVGSNRSFVQSWTVEDFDANLDTGLRGRTPEIGKRLFVEASCAQCHKAGDLAAGNVGPGLEQVMQRWKGDTREVLREILDPSHRIDPKYVVHIVITDFGDTITGLVVSEDDDTVSILENPEATEPLVVERDEIVGMRKTSNSMMPKGLLDRFSQDEVLEILAFIQSIQVEE